MDHRSFLALIALAGSATAQSTPVYDFVHSPQPAAGARFGTSTAVLDWNADGHLDLAVGAPGEGRVYVMLSDGHPTQPTYTFLPPALEPAVPQAGDEFGFDVFAAELDGDPEAELVVGAPERMVNGVSEVGAAYVFGLAAGTLELAAPKVEPARFGVCVTSGDVDDDGTDDVVVTAPHADVGGAMAGKVYVFYGPFNGAIRLRTLANPQGATQWGNYGNEAVVQDVGGDGRADLIVSAIGNISAGIVAAGQAFAHYGPLPQPGSKPVHLPTPILLEDEWPDLADIPGPRFGMSIAARAGIVAIGANRKNWAGKPDTGVGFIYQGPRFVEPPVRVLRPPPTEFDLLGIDCAIVDLVGDSTPEVVFSSTSGFSPPSILVWDAYAPMLPMQLLAPSGAGDHFANGPSWGQLVPGGFEELVLGDGTYDDLVVGLDNVGRVAILVGIQ